MLEKQSGSAHIGTSGWSYDHWNNVLYPPGLPAKDRLAHYASRFSTVELNASFYRWPRESAFAGWQRRLPAGFAMSVKAPRGRCRRTSPATTPGWSTSWPPCRGGSASASNSATPAGTTRRCTSCSSATRPPTAS
jgi:hypothetical protein